MSDDSIFAPGNLTQRNETDQRSLSGFRIPDKSRTGSVDHYPDAYASTLEQDRRNDGQLHFRRHSYE